MHTHTHSHTHKHLNTEAYRTTEQREQQREQRGEEEEYYERPPAPPGPENDAMEYETFSNALKAGFVVLSVLSVVAVFSLAGPVLRVITETFPAGRGPQ